jgi:mannose-6-phosphate isomerase-like protein (cupin superfamily)
MTLTVGGPREAGTGPWRVLAGSELTGGAVGFGDARIPPHTAGPDLHVHSREDEASYVIAGVMTFVVGDRTFEAGPETLVWLPRGVPHTFANRGDEEARVFGATIPGDIQAMFREQSAYFTGLTGPPDPGYMAELAARFGLTSLGPPLEV